ncbi:tRNA (guanine(10)-N(2))-dimethyltransferase [Candidatus Bathyarchaeota archaeon]|nr:tRNA (guanine(10)-N(2))-dimethyltransferase [Candidatus Bathyarchaeota archaeon]
MITDFERYSIVTEGSVKIVLPSEISGFDSKVFYNPRMALCRDLSVLAARQFQSEFGRPLKIADPMTGSGIRGLRYAAEVESVERVFLNDILPESATVAYVNSMLNRLGDKVDIQCLDANLFLNLHSTPGKRFNLIDLDPYGSPAPYLDSAVRSLVDGGLLAMTATDMAVLCGVKSSACLRKYGCRPLRCEYSKEIGLRLLIGALISIAGRQGVAVKLKFSHSTGHYLRVYAMLTRSAREAADDAEKIGYVKHCFTCLSRSASKGLVQVGKCGRCGEPSSFAGPLYLGSLADRDFVEGMLRIYEMSNGRYEPQLGRILGLVLEEIDGPPTYYTVDSLCRRVGVVTPSPKSLVDYLKGMGYRSMLTHFDSRGFKTEAPIDVIEGSILSLRGRR